MAKAYLKMALILFFMASYCISVSKASRVVKRGSTCASEADCKDIRCFIGRAHCIDKICQCQFQQASIVVNQERQGSSPQHDVFAARCRKDGDCKSLCPHNCKSTNCISGTCFCSC